MKLAGGEKSMYKSLQALGLMDSLGLLNTLRALRLQETHIPVEHLSPLPCMKDLVSSLLAGDLHFFMRHSFQSYSMNPLSPSLAPSLVPSELSTPQGSSPQGMSPTGSMSPTMAPSLRNYMSPSQLHQTLMARLNGTAPQQASTSSGRGASSASKLAPLQKHSGWPTAAQGLGGQQSPSRQGSLSGQQQPVASSPFLAVQQQQQQLVFGRSLDMEYVTNGGSPSGGSPSGGSPTLPSMLLSHEEEDLPAPLLQGRPTAIDTLPGKVKRQAFKRDCDEGAGSSIASGDAPPCQAAEDDGSPPTTPTIGSRLGPGFVGRISSAALPVGARRKNDTLPILSPVHGSQMELASLEDCVHEGPLFVSAVIEPDAVPLAAKRNGASDSQKSHGASVAERLPLDAGAYSTSSPSGSLQANGTIRSAHRLSTETFLRGSPPSKSSAPIGLSPVGESPGSSVAGSMSSASGLSGWWSRCKNIVKQGDDFQKQDSDMARKGSCKLESDGSTGLPRHAHAVDNLGLNAMFTTAYSLRNSSI